MKTVAAIHTASPMVEPTKKLFAEHLPDVRLFNIADDSLIQDVIRDGEVTTRTARRLLGYYFAAVDTGADLIFNTCSSVGEVVDAVQPVVAVPIMKIDEPMVTSAVQQATRIGVLATLPTTLGPTVRLVRKRAQALNKDVEVVEGLAEGAFAAVIAGDAAKHDSLILQTAQKVAQQVDLIVLAQGSMARMEDTLRQKTGKTVMSSPILGVLAVKEKLALME
ncbi:aspartate/glutamate racemase family protein [Planctomycetota bacterium]